MSRVQDVYPARCSFNNRPLYQLRAQHRSREWEIDQLRSLGEEGGCYADSAERLIIHYVFKLTK